MDFCKHLTKQENINKTMTTTTKIPKIPFTKDKAIHPSERVSHSPTVAPQQLSIKDDPRTLKGPTLTHAQGFTSHRLYTILSFIPGCGGQMWLRTGTGMTSMWGHVPEVALFRSHSSAKCQFAKSVNSLFTHPF